MYNWQKPEKMDTATQNRINAQLKANDRTCATVSILSSLMTLMITVPIAASMHGKASGITLIIGSITSLSIIAAMMIQKKINNSIRHGEFEWCTTVYEDITHAKIAPYAKIKLSDGTHCLTPENIDHFANGKDVILISIGNNGNKYVFAKE